MPGVRAQTQAPKWPELPKWNRRSRLGQFLGYSDKHSSLVANIRHLKTGFISPQYHVVFDDLFESVFSSGPNDVVVDAICEDLYRTSCEVYAIDEYDAHDNLVYKPPPLDEVWLDAEGREQSKIQLRQQRKRNEELMRNREVWRQPLLLRGAMSLVCLFPMEH